MAEPLLDPPCTGWQADLPLPDASTAAQPSLGFDEPNHMDEVWLEIPRRWMLLRGPMFWLSILMGACCIRVLQSTIGSWKEHLDSSITITGMACFLISFWITSFALRVDISPPRDLPLRFNRTRQKLYAYNFKYRWWNPFERWRVIPVAYDWSQVRAEAWKQRGVTAQGGYIVKWGVVLSIVAPGTNKVIDRFALSTMGADEYAWAYICTYMQQGPQALPPPGEPRDPNRVPWYNLALRLAPKVTWPEAMDIESRTAP